MKRTTIMLPEEVDRRLRYEARRRGISLADLAREAITAYLPEPPAERRLSFAATGEAPDEALLEAIDEAVAKGIASRSQRDRRGY